MSVLRAFEIAEKTKKERNWDTLYIALDIHSTVLKPNYEGLATEFYPYALETLQEISRNPVYKIILWTCSKKEDIKVYRKLLEDNDIKIFAENSNPDLDGVLDWGDYSKKMYTNIIIDDKAGFDAENEWLYLNKWLYLNNYKIRQIEYLNEKR